MTMKHRQTAENKEVSEMLSYPSLHQVCKRYVCLEFRSLVFLWHETIITHPLRRKITLKTTPKNLLICSLTSCDVLSQSSSSFVLQDFLDKAIKSEIAAALKTSDNTNARRFPLERVDHLERKRSSLVFSVISKIVNQVQYVSKESKGNQSQL